MLQRPGRLKLTLIVCSQLDPPPFGVLEEISAEKQAFAKAVDDLNVLKAQKADEGDLLEQMSVAKSALASLKGI
eukprot:15213176-Alexandrium_andersonii.AAC.1